MVITIVIYAVFTGLSGLAQDWIQLAALQAIAGFGIGGEWAAGRLARPPCPRPILLQPYP